MCTVTWLERDGGYALFCSRDELRTRGPARRPRRHRGGGVDFLAPIDTDGGGTWVAVNDRGLALTLLNDYASDQGRGRFESRGRLVGDLVTTTSPEAALARLAALDLGRYRPFRLVLLAPGSAARIRHWNGRREAAEEPSGPALLTSSSFDPAAADSARRELLARVAGATPSAEALLAFHRSHQPERGPLSPCMHRADARTVSFTRLEVDGDRAVMSYLDGPPCRRSASAAEIFELRLRSPRATASA